MAEITFAERGGKDEVERGEFFTPKFNADGLIPVCTTDAATGELLMQAFMNDEAVAKTIELGEAVYYSRSRQELWHKGATSGHTQKVVEMRTDCDQDAIWLRVEQHGPGACHVGYRSCFYRSIPVGEAAEPGAAKLVLEETEQAYDAKKVYGK